MPRSYIRLLFGSCLLALLAALGLNAVVDPYGIHRWIDQEGFNKRKPRSGTNGQMVKPYRVIATRPRTLALGNSRVEAGIDPESPAWPEALRPVYNMALPASDIYIALRSLQHATSADAVRVVVVGVDFFDYVFNEQAPLPTIVETSDFERRLLVRADGSPNEYRPVQKFKDEIAAMLSLNGVADTLQTVTLQRIADGTDLTALGFNPMNEYRRLVRVEGHRELFRQMDATYITNYLRLARPALYRGASSPDFDYLRRVVALCRNADIRLILYVHPYHAHMLENYRLAGMWPLFEEWKRALVRIVESDAVAVGKGTVELWDFSGYNELTIEPVPREKGQAMRWYWEAGHYKRELGDLLLARMLGTGTEAATPAIGVRLTSANIDAHLAAIRAERQRYADERPEEVAALAATAQRVREQAAQGPRRSPFATSRPATE